MKIILLLCLLILNTVLPSAHAGGCGGHGGDSYSLEFYRLGKHLAEELMTWRPEDFAKLGKRFIPQEFQNAVERTRIVSVQEPLILQGRPVDAINNSDSQLPVIEINRVRWDGYANSRTRKLSIVLHEYLGIVQGLYGHGEWDDYPISNEILAIYEQKYAVESDLIHKKKLSQIVESFSNAGSVKSFGTNSDFPWSCVEFSALEKESSRYVLKDAFIILKGKNYGSWHPDAKHTNTPHSLVREWTDKDPTEEVDRPLSVIKEFLRETASGDLVSEITTDYLYKNQIPSMSDPGRGVLSYLYCSKIGSKAINLTKYIHQSLDPYFDTPLQPDFQLYTDKMREIAESNYYDRCKKSNQSACLKFFTKMGEVTLPYETQVISKAKTNINSVNAWLNSLSTKENAFALIPVSKIFDKYMVHQSYISALMRLNDPTPYSRDPGLDEFITSLEFKIPEAYKSAKLLFKQDLESVQNSFIRNDFIFGMVP